MISIDFNKATERYDLTDDGVLVTTGATYRVAELKREALYGPGPSTPVTSRMPPPPIVFPADYPIRFHLNADDVADAFAALLADADDTTRRALRTAQRHMANARTAMSGGKLHLSSPNSGNTYRCTRTSCTCEGATRWNVATCWHRQAAAAVRAVFDSYQPSYRCPHCAGPMCAERTPSGAPCFGCLICRTIRYPTTVADLQPWPSMVGTSDLQKAA